MQKNPVQLPEIKLMGIITRTNNASEMDPSTAKISSTVQKYFQNSLSEKIISRTKPGTTYGAYTEYESDFTGDYTYFIGEEVTSFDKIPEEFSTISIPAQNYTRFTNGPGSMPDVCINAWQEIWGMTSKDLGGERKYLADFEIYDERAHDHRNTILDIYIGITI